MRVIKSKFNDKHRNEYPYFITAIKHGYKCFISILTRLYLLNVLN